MGQTICLSKQTSANQLNRKRMLTADSIPKSISCLSQRSKNIFPKCHSFFFLNYALHFWWMLTDGSWMLTDAKAAMLTSWGATTVVFKIVPYRFWLAVFGHKRTIWSLLSHMVSWKKEFILNYAFAYLKFLFLDFILHLHTSSSGSTSPIWEFSFECLNLLCTTRNIVLFLFHTFFLSKTGKSSQFLFI